MGTELELQDAQYYKDQYDVVQQFVQNKNPTEIARNLNLKRTVVLKHIEEFRESSRGSTFLHDRIEELILTFDEHYSLLIRKFYEIVTEIDDLGSTNPAMLAQKNSALKQIADLEAKRIDILQKSGLLEAADNKAEVEAMQANIDTLMQILEEELCDNCRRKVWDRLGTLTGKVEAVVVYEQR